MKTTAFPGHHLASPAPVVYCALFPFDTGLESDYLTALSPVKGEKSDPGISNFEYTPLLPRC